MSRLVTNLRIAVRALSPIKPDCKKNSVDLMSSSSPSSLPHWLYSSCKNSPVVELANTSTVDTAQLISNSLSSSRRGSCSSSQQETIVSIFINFVRGTSTRCTPSTALVERASEVQLF